MNSKTIILATSALALLAACSKSEVLPVESAPQEITFQTVETKAASNFDTGNHFYSYAYFLEEGKTLDANSADAKAYIYGSEIEYVSAETAWKNATTKYYWPKKGSLTFFAWTGNTASPAVDPENAVSCAAASGIKFTDYDITSATNKNKDLLVADIAKDQKENTTQYDGWKEGVPTVFKHILSNLVFNIKTDYATSKDEYASVTFKLKSIELKNVNTKGTYTQGEVTSTPAWTAKTAPWSSQTGSKTLEIFNGTLAVTKATDEATAITSSYSIVLPQTFAAVTTIDNSTPVITVVYDIVTYYTGTAVTKTITVTKSLNEIYSGSWEPAKKYTLTLIVGLNEILWDPDITDWTGVSSSINI